MPTPYSNDLRWRVVMEQNPLPPDSGEDLMTALCFEGTLNGTVFLYFLEHFLCPLLKPGQYMILDNASPHNVEGVRELIEKTGACLLYLPPYSPVLKCD